MSTILRASCVGSAVLLFITSFAQVVAARKLIDSHEYDYDSVSNIVERTSGGVTTEFGYDLVGQLISETRNGYSASYNYDANGNRLTRTVNSVTEEYEYDAAGRTTSITTSAGAPPELTVPRSPPTIF